MKVHFIAIGGSAMHNLALALHKKGYQITGSDDEIFEPSKSRLKAVGLLPEKQGWNIDNITDDIDAVILGMHARKDNPELLKAKELKLNIYSYPEYLYEQTKNKTRVIIGGSHGKTTITSIIMHVLKYHKIKFDYMVGAQIEGFDTMVHLSNESEIAVFEGDEYLSSPIDRRPKFHLYHPHIALISGIAWDHINVFPTFENYINQFKIFIELIKENGFLTYYADDKVLTKLVESVDKKITKQAYLEHPNEIKNGKSDLKNNTESIPIQIFGKHNMQNIQGAKNICSQLNISEKMFYEAIKTFRGASKRLQLLKENKHSKFYFDFAHSPSKLKATVDAVANQYPDKKLIAVMELHTFSSLNKIFLMEYKGAMNLATQAFVFYNPETISHKKLQNLSKDEVKNAFQKRDLEVFDDSDMLVEKIKSLKIQDSIVLVMTSGNFSGIDINHFSEELIV